MNINNRLAMAIGSVILVAGALTILYVNSRMKAHALYEAKNTAGVILDSRLSVHTYFSHQLKPALFDIASESAPELAEKFEPAWMSSTYAVREMEKYFKSLQTTAYYYKEAAINARHPENEADAFEREFIQRLNREDSLHIISGIRTFNDTPYFTVLQRGETMEATCLRCHSEPDSAPPGLVDAYGPQRSFERTLGEVISAISIRIPLDEAYAKANQISSQLAFAFGAALLGIFFMIIFLNKRWVFTPLAFIREKAQRIATDPKKLGEQIKTPTGWELAKLTDSFNSMSSQLFEERCELEDRVRKRTAELQEANAQKDRLFSIIAHDLKSPVAGLYSTSQILAREAKSMSLDDICLISTAMHKSSKNTLELLNDLMQWARLNQGGMDFSPEKCSLYELSRSSLDTAQDVAGKKNITIKCDIPQGLTIMADQPMINTVIRNVIFNAVKFTPQGGHITITATNTDSGVEVCVQDDGIGMNDAIRSSIFTVDKGKQQLGTGGEKGTGLGLILCKEFVEKHGGKIWVESEPDRGTKVYFTLPDVS